MSNRDIKFRAWYDNGKDKGMFFVGDAYGTTHPLDCCRYAQDGQPVTLMQYTGLKDANGVEIYEGDIVAHEWIKKDRYDSGEFVYGVIKFVNGRFVESYKISERKEDFEKIDGENRIVVGNIYQNSDLLS